MIGYLVSSLIHFGIGIYSAVILGNNSSSIVPSDVYGFTLTICILHFIAGMGSILSMLTQKRSIVDKLLDVAILGLFIWSCVILFAQDGNLLKDYNPYYMVVFVYFIINVVLLGLAILIVPCMCCYMCYKIDKIDTKELEAVQKSLDAALKECELALKNKSTPVTPPICDNV